MKTTLKLFLTVLLIPVVLFSQETESQYIEWRGNDTIANAMVWQGINHLMNIENEKAYTFFEAAVAKDPSLFAPHVVLANLSWGDKREHHKAEAKKMVEGKNEVSKLYVSILDIDRKASDAADQWRSKWKKMYELAFEGRFVHYNYARSLEDIDARIAELEKLAGILEKSGSNNGHVHNLLGYTYYTKGDKEKAKMHLDKYLELWPNGYNSYDSMAEYFMNEGDMENALAYYKKARKHYPGAMNAANKIKEIEAKMSDKEEMEK
jgi:Tfp pilus assembly protein PilF